MLAARPHVTTVDVRNSSLGYSAATRIAAALGASQVVTSLDVSGNLLGEAGVPGGCLRASLHFRTSPDFQATHGQSRFYHRSY